MAAVIQLLLVENVRIVVRSTMCGPGEVSALSKIKPLGGA